MNRQQEKDLRVSQGGAQLLIDIRYSQNASWQGTVKRLDTGESINFRSVLELISLVEKAVSEQKIIQEDQRFRSWTASETMKAVTPPTGTDDRY